MPPDPTATVADLDIDDEKYDSAEDEDFRLEEAEDDEALTGSDSDEGATEPATKRRKTGVKEAELDSGDEVTIQKAKARKDKQKGKKSKNKDGEHDEDDVDFDDDEEGGPGGFVRTRAMRMRMHEERKPLARIDGATVDVDALWAKMNDSNSNIGLPLSQTDKKDNAPVNEEKKAAETHEHEIPSTQEKKQYSEEMVKIKRIYKFAGEMITEEKIVPKDSAEAKLFLASGKNVETVTDADVEDAANRKAALKLRRPLRKISRFDPNPTGVIKKSWEKQPTAEVPGQAENAQGPKINTVEKSRLDWANYVDQAGIKDELKVHSKAKEGFHGRMEFLDRNNGRTIAVLVAAKSNDLDIELVQTEANSTLPFNQSAEYTKIHPLGKIPAFEGSNGYTLTEAIAIAVYVTSQNEKTTLLGKTKQDYASILCWLSFSNAELLPKFAAYKLCISAYMVRCNRYTSLAADVQEWDSDRKGSNGLSCILKTLSLLT